MAAEREPQHELLPLRYSTGRWVSGMCQCVYVCVGGDNIHIGVSVCVCVVNTCDKSWPNMSRFLRAHESLSSDLN